MLDNYINNFAFIHALLIKYTIENSRIDNKEKNSIKKSILDFLKNAWILIFIESKSHHYSII